MNSPQKKDDTLNARTALIRERWNRITADDLKMIGGSREKLLARLEERYGYPRDRAMKELNAFETEILEHQEHEVPVHSR